MWSNRTQEREMLQCHRRSRSTPCSNTPVQVDIAQGGGQKKAKATKEVTQKEQTEMPEIESQK